MQPARFSLAGVRRHPVLLCGAPPREMLARLEPFFEIETEGMPLDAAALKARLAGKAALLATGTAGVDAVLLAGLPYLRAVCKMAPAHDDIDLEACTRAGVMATNTPDLGEGDDAARRMALAAADNLVAAFGFGRIGGHPANLLNTDLRCMLGCCL
jgi:lactate dehydrogenase-like 2-hydroxyacid dehydrogenase